MKNNKKLPIPALSVVACLAALVFFDCGKNAGERNESRERQPQASVSHKITGSGEGLCRIVMVQNRPARESEAFSEDNAKKVVFTALTDGSGGRVVADLDSIAKKILAGGDQEDKNRLGLISKVKPTPQVTRDLKNLIFEISYRDGHWGGVHRRLQENLALVNLDRAGIDFLIKDSEEEYNPKEKSPEGPTYHFQGFGAWRLFQHSPVALMRKSYSFWAVDFATDRRIVSKPDEKITFFLPLSAVECYVNFFYPAQMKPFKPKFHLGKFNVQTGKISALPAAFDSFSIEANSISEDGNTILIFHAAQAPIPWDRREDVPITKAEDTLQIDSVLVFDRDFKKKKSFVLVNGAVDFELDPTGDWLYFGNGCEIFRYRLDRIADKERTSFDELLKKAETVWSAPVENEKCFSYEYFYLTRIKE